MATTKYGKLVETLRSGILSGKYGLGLPFPSVRALIRRHGLSDSTVQRALDVLSAQGLITRQQGRGTFVTVGRATGAARVNGGKIGIIVPDHARSEFFPVIAREISRLAQKEGCTLLFGEVSAETEEGRIEQMGNLAADFVRQGVAGVIFQPIDYVKDGEKANRKVLAKFDAASVPVVLCDYDCVDAPERSVYDVVGINNVEAGALVVRHLAAQGARRVCFHLKPYAPQSHKNFVRGAIAEWRALSGATAHSRVLECPPDDVAAVQAYCRRNRPDAFVCGNDSCAAKLKKALASIGLCVPRDLFLTGVNDVQIAQLLTPTLTTIHIPCEQVAQAAFERLLVRIANPTLPPVEINLPVSLVVRGSTKPTKARSAKTS